MGLPLKIWLRRLLGRQWPTDNLNPMRPIAWQPRHIVSELGIILTCGDKVRASDAGVSEYIVEPWQVNDVVTKVRNTEVAIRWLRQVLAPKYVDGRFREQLPPADVA